MKLEKFSFSRELGLTQFELATALKISRAHMSLVDCRRRNLTTDAREIHTAMLLHVNAARQSAKPMPDAAIKNAEKQKIVARSLGKTNFQQDIIKRKIEAYENNQRKIEKRRLALDFLNSDQYVKMYGRPVKSSICENSLNKVGAECSISLFKLNCQLKRLEADAVFYQSQLQELQECAANLGLDAPQV